ncbi:sulfite exporter TauE/SafE [Nanobdella aerobiophila]|uniref:Probable membrane transporter protein n=2 Tax=Nanobdella aerobiophila TaxID=2586965 RepID=A0A915WT14_9ARCH|nr:sulfite exporter TauE/SafE [Nanobdella aerobiophila]
MIVPLLLLLNFNLLSSVGSSLLFTQFVALLNISRYIKDYININLGLLLSLIAVIGVFMGKIIESFIINERMIYILYVLLLSIFLFVTIYKRKIYFYYKNTPEYIKKLELYGYIYDKGAGIYYYPQNLKFGIPFEIFAGFSSVLLGGGAGLISNVNKTYIMKVPIKASIATSFLIILLTSTFSGILYSNYIDINIVFYLILGSIVGTIIGNYLMNKLNTKYIYSILIFILSLLISLLLSKIIGYHNIFLSVLIALLISVLYVLISKEEKYGAYKDLIINKPKFKFPLYIVIVEFLTLIVLYKFNIRFYNILYLFTFLFLIYLLFLSRRSNILYKIIISIILIMLIFSIYNVLV